MKDSVYHRVGLKPVINALGIYTDLGGSRPSPRVWAAMEESNRWYIRMPELLDATGSAIASLLGTDSARVTGGASVAVAIATAACMTGGNPRKGEQLPDTTGMHSDVLIQRRHRYKYDRMVRLAGAHLIEVGNVNGTDLDEIESAIGPGTAAICFPAHLDGVPGTVALEQVVALAHQHGLPTMVDAAYLNYPVDTMRRLAAVGAEAVIFSAKYFGGPNTGGIVCGDSELIRAIARLDFTGYEESKYLSFGRPYKLDRQLIVGVLEALREWLEMDHADRFAGYAARVQAIACRLGDLPGVELTPMCFTMQGTLEAEPVNCLHIRTGRASGTARVLEDGDPSVLVHLIDDALVADVECLTDEEAQLVGDRLREELARARPSRLGAASHRG